jgi:hypothetical protein
MKSVHRFLVLLILVLGLIMMGTGTTMKYSEFFLTTMPFINLFAMRNIHNLVSVIFSIVFIIQLVSGIVLFLFPILQKQIKSSS